MVIRFPSRPPAPKTPATQLSLFPRELTPRRLTPREVQHRVRMLQHLRRLGARP